MNFFFFFFGFFIFAYRFFWKANTEKQGGSPGYEFIAHRGLQAMAPENTMAAYLGAEADGFQWLELDVACTKDGQVYCTHNLDLEMETDLFGYIFDLNSEELNSAFTGIRTQSNQIGHRVPSLDCVLSNLPTNVSVNIEVKYKNTFDFSTARALRSLLIKHHRRNIIISSFNPVVLGYIKLFYNNAPIGFLVESKKYFWVINWLQPEFIHPRADMLNKSFFEMCKRRNLKILTWTVNNKAALDWCIKNNIHGIITDERSFIN